MQTFQPFTGFDPLDGDDRRVEPARGNPCYDHAGDREADALVGGGERGVVHAAENGR